MCCTTRCVSMQIFAHKTHFSWRTTCIQTLHTHKTRTHFLHCTPGTLLTPRATTTSSRPGAHTLNTPLQALQTKHTHTQHTFECRYFVDPHATTTLSRPGFAVLNTRHKHHTHTHIITHNTHFNACTLLTPRATTALSRPGSSSTMACARRRCVFRQSFVCFVCMWCVF